MRRSLDPELRLPQFASNLALEWAGEYIIEKNADIMAAVDEFWASKVSEHGEDYVCGPDDIVEAFQLILDLRDPLHTSGVSIKNAEGKTVLSWETSEMAVHVGSKRAPIGSAKVLFNKIMHEFGVHGQRAINGLKHNIPVMGLGVFTDTGRPDYLTFEEGLATTIEEMSGDDTPAWDAAKLGHYINIAEVVAGEDFRGVFEKSWRYKLLAKIRDNEEVTDEMIKKEKSAAYTSCVRIFRGQPNNIADLYPGIKPLSFNKDLAYLNGRVLAMRYLETIHQTMDKEALDLLFDGKFDPTIPEQLAIAVYSRAT
ncbi:MAG: tyrosine/phenylalanine carboxypeptidase domain-containing protein [Candidatus Saccharimonadaceae bacterium]